MAASALPKTRESQFFFLFQKEHVSDESWNCTLTINRLRVLTICGSESFAHFGKRPAPKVRIRSSSNGGRSPSQCLESCRRRGASDLIRERKDTREARCRFGRSIELQELWKWKEERSSGFFSKSGARRLTPLITCSHWLAVLQWRNCGGCFNVLFMDDQRVTFSKYHYGKLKVSLEARFRFGRSIGRQELWKWKKL